MTTLILIDEDCSIKQQKSRVNRDTLYKKCGFIKNDGFNLQHTWVVETSNIHSVEIWAKDAGLVDNENKYTLPSPLNAKVYYGTIALVAVNEKGDIISMNIEKWKKIYEHLYGDIESEELQSDEEEDEPESISAKEPIGHLKDDYDCEDSNEEGEEENDIDEVPNVRKLPSESELDDEDLITQIHCGSELEEEEYVYSDTE